MALPPLLCGAVWLLACVDGTASSLAQSRSAHGRYCRALCARLTSCIPGYRLPTCMDVCENDPNVDTWNEQIWSGQIECIGAQSCLALEDDTAYETCFEVAAQSLIPSDDCVEFCITDAAASFECGGGYSVEECVAGLFCTWHDEVIQRGDACNTNLDCEARAACQAGALGGP
jgi:hypothetical protein